MICRTMQHSKLLTITKECIKRFFCFCILDEFVKAFFFSSFLLLQNLAV